MKLTSRQRLALQAILIQVEERGYPPSVRELCTATGLRSTSSVAYVLRSLEWKGALVRHGGARAITITDKGKAAVA